MNTQNIGSFKQTNGIQDDYGDAGNYIGVIFYFSGTNNTGETGAFSNLGRVLTERGEKQKDNISFDDLRKIMDIRGGKCLLDSTTGGAFEAYVMIPFFEETVASALHILGNEEFNVEWQPSDDGTVFNDLSLKVFARTADFPELGKLNFNRKDETYSSQKTADTLRPKYGNIQSLYVDDVDDNITLIQVDSSIGSVQDAAPYGVLRGITLQENNIEDNSFDFARLPFNTPGQISYNNGTVITVSVGTGGGTVGLITANWEPS